MASLPTSTATRRLALALAVASGLTGNVVRAYATDTASESAQLATIERQLDTVDRLAAQSEQLPDSGSTHEHFDYARLHADIARVREGIQDYLNPRRPLPRDPFTLVGHYRERTDSP